MRQFLKTTLKILLIVALIFGPIGFQYAHAFLGIGEFTANASRMIVEFLANLMLGLASLVLAIAGAVLNQSVQYTVLQMSNTLSQITSINEAWGVIRDLANMLFIFVLLYVAIGTILGLSKVNWKKTLVLIVIAALLINFSLFFTKIIVDASNIVALAFYKGISTCTTSNGLSGCFMEHMKLTTLYKCKSTGSFGECNLEDKNVAIGKIVVIGIMGFAFNLVAAFVFFAAAIMFIVRFAIIVFLLILSPLAFAAMILPKLAEYANKWWKQLIGQAVFAPVFMILAWVTLKILSTIGGNPATGQKGVFGQEAGAALSNLAVTSGEPDVSTVGLFMNFIVVIAFMVGTLIISRQVSKQGGTMAQKAVGAAFGLGVGVAAYGGRRLIGGQARKIADDKELRDKAAAGDIGARLKLRTAQGLARSSFDIRKPTAAFGGALGMGDLGIDNKIGARKGGYDEYIKQKTKKKTEFAKSFEATDIEIDDAKRELELAKQGGDEARILIAQKELDHLIGVKPQEAEKRAKELDDEMNRAQENDPMVQKEKALEKEVAKKEEELENIIIPELRTQREKELEVQRSELEQIKKEANTARQEIKDRYETRKKTEAITRESVGKRRKNTYAESISHPGTFSSERVFFVGKVKRQSRQAAAEIRKDKKTVEEELKKILKEEKEITEREEKETGATQPTTGGTAPLSGA